MPAPEPHDGAYKLLFSHPLMVRELLLGFVREAWVRQLDFATLERVNGHYVSDRLQQRSDDLVWRVRMVDGGGWLYVYLLLEFQSRSDRWMALRLMSYVGLLWQDLVRSGRLARGNRLPPVFPLVLYNGRPRWSAPRMLQPLLAAPDDGALSDYQPRFRYFLFDEGRVSAGRGGRGERSEQGERAGEERLSGSGAGQDERHEPEANAVDCLLALECSRDLETLQREIARLRKRLAAPEHDSLRRAFTVWIHRVALGRMIPGQDVPPTETLEETEAMLAERVTEWTREWKREGLQQGLQQGLERGLEQGLERGRLEGRRQTLQRLLARRFGPLPGAAMARLEAADARLLDEWTERLLDAASLDEVFQESP